MVGADDERLEVLFSWFDGESGRPIEDDLDDYLAEHDRLPRQRRSLRRRRPRRSNTA